MSLAKSGNIQYVCEPNAMSTIMEYALDYGDDAFKIKVEKLVRNLAKELKREDIKEIFLKNLEKLKNGERDLYL